MKLCSKCNIEKDDDCFGRKKNRNGSYRLASRCKPCSAAWCRERRAIYTEEEKARVRETNNKYRNGKGREIVIEAKRRNRMKKAQQRAEETGRFTGLAAKHEAHVKRYAKHIKRMMTIKHDSHVSEWKRSPGRISAWRYKHDPAYVMYSRVKNSIYKYVKTGNQSKTSMYLQCSTDKLKRHIEDRFLPGMTWDNRDEWHIDHIIPVSYFDLSVEEQAKECYSLSNLRPLWAKDNSRKRDSFEFNL